MKLYNIYKDKITSFEPDDIFIEDCSPVCGNCKYWIKELFSYDINNRMCKICNEVKNCGSKCDVYIGG